MSALTGFSLDHVLSSLQLPGGSGLNNQLGIEGLPALNAKQIYNDRYDDDEGEAVGPGHGKDWEDEVDREIEDEEDEDDDVFVKDEVQSPQAFQRRRRTRIVKRLIERPKSVYVRFPAFEQGKVLDFTELFKGQVSKKSRVSKRPPFTSKSVAQIRASSCADSSQSRQSIRRRKRRRRDS